MHKIIKAATVAAVALGLIALPSAAQASNSEPAASASTVSYATYPLKARSVGNGQINFNAVDWLQLGAQARAHIVALEKKAAAAEARAVAAENKADDALARPDAGKTETLKVFDPKLIEFIGGPYFDPARGFTTLGTFTLPTGTWTVNTSVVFKRTVSGDAGVRPQVGLRVGQGTASPDWGTDLGTIGGNDISKVKNKELWGTAQGQITVTSPTTVGIYGHGFTDTEGSEGSNEISAAVKVSLVRAG
jgi:hypothetical protein